MHYRSALAPIDPLVYRLGTHVMPSLAVRAVDSQHAINAVLTSTQAVPGVALASPIETIRTRISSNLEMFRASASGTILVALLASVILGVGLHGATLMKMPHQNSPAVNPARNRPLRHILRGSLYGFIVAAPFAIGEAEAHGISQILVAASYLAASLLLLCVSYMFTRVLRPALASGSRAGTF